MKITLLAYRITHEMPADRYFVKVCRKIAFGIVSYTGWKSLYRTIGDGLLTMDVYDFPSREHARQAVEHYRELWASPSGSSFEVVEEKTVLG